MIASDPRVPRFTAVDARRLAREYFFLDVTVATMPSTLDANFKLTTADGEHFVMKIANTDETYENLDFENEAMVRLTEAGIHCPLVYPNKDGVKITALTDEEERSFQMRLLSFVPGSMMVDLPYHSNELLRDLGRTVAEIAKVLANFSHPAMDRELQWDLIRANKFRHLIKHVDNKRLREMVTAHMDHFEAAVLPVLPGLRRGVVHNDANDYNVFAEGDRVTGIIDFGDLVNTQLINDLAITCAYAAFGKSDPLAAAMEVAAGFHALCPLLEKELEVLFPLITMRQVSSVVLSAYQQKREPDNAYLESSLGPAAVALAYFEQVHPSFALACFRRVCGLEPHPRNEAVVAWLKDHGSRMGKLVDPPVQDALIFDFGPHGRDGDHFAEGSDVERFSAKLFGAMAEAGTPLGIGRYNEKRRFYCSEHFRPTDGAPPRTVHLGIDLFLESGSSVYAPLEGTVHSFADNVAPLDYGPTLILEHCFGQVTFYSLYGHLRPDSLTSLCVGQAIVRGQKIGKVGDWPRNGNWPPHLHFQLMVDMLGKRGDFPGVATQAYREEWLSFCPDPNMVLGHVGLSSTANGRSPRQLRAQRARSLGPMLSLSYSSPLKIVRGSAQYLYDETGRAFLDMVNNVCHLGHCHPRVVAAASQQLATLNTNTRYLHDNILDYASRLVDTMPDPLNVCFLVCTGSEANDLALRMARNHTGRHDAIVVDGAYHGNLSSLIALSPYKFDGPGGKGRPHQTHVVAAPDGYRGRLKHGDPELGARYADEVRLAVEAARRNGDGPALFLCESVLGCGGQVVLPPDYLAQAYSHVRAAGGVCLADEVQVGFGRVGSHMWAFETQGVVPDIVTLGKPIGNGFPMAAVVTTEEIARSFNTGMEYFNTFGGNPVSCAVGLATLDVIRDEKLRENALKVGNRLLERLALLAPKFPIIGEVRGLGLFLGVELVNNPMTLDPAARQASYIVERLKQEDILLSIDGPLHNVLKIKPPLCFSAANADYFADCLESILEERGAKSNA